MTGIRNKLCAPVWIVVGSVAASAGDFDESRSRPLDKLESPSAASVTLQVERKTNHELHEKWLDLALRIESVTQLEFHDRVIARDEQGLPATSRRWYSTCRRTENDEIDDFGLEGLVAEFTFTGGPNGGRRVQLQDGRHVDDDMLNWILGTGHAMGLTIHLEPVPDDPQQYLVGLLYLANLLILDGGPVECPKQPLKIDVDASTESVLVLSGPYRFETLGNDSNVGPLAIAGKCRVEIDPTSKQLRRLELDADLRANGDRRMNARLHGSLIVKLQIHPEPDDAPPPELPAPTFRARRSFANEHGISISLPSYYFRVKNSTSAEEKFLRGLDTRHDSPFIGLQRFDREGVATLRTLSGVEAELAKTFPGVVFDDAESPLGMARRCILENDGHRFLNEYHLTDDGALIRTRFVCKSEFFDSLLPEYEAAIATLSRL